MKKNKIDINTNVKRVSNIILNSKTHIQSICCVNFGEDSVRDKSFYRVTCSGFKEIEAKSLIKRSIAF